MTIRTALVLAVAVCASTVGPRPLAAQFQQQGPGLVGSGAAGNARQGSSLALSGDGNAALVAGPADNDSEGAVWAFARNGSTWQQVGSKLVGAGAVGPPNFGVSVALSADGLTALVGGNGDADAAGAAWVFTLQSGVWTAQGSKLVGLEAAGPAQQGVAVALSGDGNTALVGGPRDNKGAGAVWVFTRNGGVWTQQGGKLVGTGAAGPGFLGNAVALSADGNTALVGAPYDDSGNGAAWVFTRTGETWTQQGNKLVGSGDETAENRQGTSVSLSADGNTAVVGGRRGDPPVSTAWLFTRNGGSWTQRATFLLGPPAVGVGRSALSGTGNIVLLGAQGDATHAAGVWAFLESGGLWLPQPTPLMGAGLGDSRPSSVALSGDGSTALLAAPGNSGGGVTWPFALLPADLMIAKTYSWPSPSALLTFVITAVNRGPGPALGATVTDQFPSILSCTWTCAGTFGAACSTAGSGDIDDTVDLPAGGLVNYMAPCTLASLGANLTNTASIKPPPGAVADPQLADNEATTVVSTPTPSKAQPSPSNPPRR